MGQYYISGHVAKKAKMREATLGQRLLQMVQDNIALAVTAAWAILVAIKAMRVSALDLTTAASILGGTEVVRLAWWVVLQTLPSAMLPLFGALAVIATQGILPKVSRFLAALGLFALLVIAILIAPWPLTVIMPILFVLTFLLGRGSSRRLTAYFAEGSQRSKEAVQSLEDLRTQTGQLSQQHAAMVEKTKGFDIRLRLRHPWRVVRIHRRLTYLDNAQQRMRPKLEQLELEQESLSRTWRDMQKSESERLLRRVLWVQVIPVVLTLPFITLLNSEPWIPSEVIAQNNGARPLVGYVVSDDGVWLTMLDAQSRQIVRLRDSIVASRKVCSEDTEAKVRSLTSQMQDFKWVVADNTPAPRCPKERETVTT